MPEVFFCFQYQLIVVSYRFGLVGGGSNPPIGTFTDYVVVERKHVIPTPNHLSSEEAAAWPVGGVTAWRSVLSLPNFRVFDRKFRAAIINAGADKGRNILVTGAGGGVALLAVQLSAAKGANVFVTSGSNDKIQKLLPLGVKDGVNYKNSEDILPWVWYLSLPQLDMSTSQRTGPFNSGNSCGRRAAVFWMRSSTLLEGTLSSRRQTFSSLARRL